MELHETFKLVGINLRANPMRSFLTMLGLIIGIGSVILIMSIGAGGQSLIVSQVNKLGSNLVGVLPGAADSKGPPASVLGIQVKTLVNDDLKALLTDDRTNHLLVGYGMVRGLGKTSYENRSLEGAAFEGVSALYPQVENITLARGRFFTTEEDSGLARVVVLGSDISQELFQGDDPLGKVIKIKQTTFKVIGELESRGTVGFMNMDKQVYIPLETGQKIMLGWRHLSLIRARVDDASNISETLAGMEQVLRERHKLDNKNEDDFSVRSANEAIDMVKNIMNGFQLFLVAVAAISLLVGGIGIMNIMLVAVTERYREIGLRKAVGATTNNIMVQFLVETLVITGLASLIGIAGGILLSGVIALVVKALDYDWSFIVPLSSVILAVVVGSAIGFVFGLYPARRAAGLDPVASLRYE